MLILRILLQISALSVLVCGLLGCAGRSPQIAVPKVMPPPVAVTKQPRVALVLGSGGAKGYAHLGVIEVLRKAGIPIDLIAGSSAGSGFGALYADTGDINQTKKIMMHAGFWDLADIGNYPNIKGIIKGYRFEKFLLKHMHARQFSQLKIPLVLAATDLKTGKTLALSSGPIAPAVLASGAMPGAVIPPKLYGHTLVDGGMADPIPVDLVERYHPKVIIAVDIDRQLGKRMPLTALGIYDRSFLISWNRLAELSAKKTDVLIRPDTGNTGTFDIDAKWKMYQAGVRAAKKALPEIKRVLAARGIDCR